MSPSLMLALALIALAPLDILGQHGTDSSFRPKQKTVLELFTGINCQWCPQGHTVAEDLYNENPDSFFIITIHQGPYADPGGSFDPDYRTTWGDELAEDSEVYGYPTGTINRRRFDDLATNRTQKKKILSRSKWDEASQRVRSEETYFEIEVEAHAHSFTRVLNLDVQLRSYGDTSADLIYLNIALLQNNILGPQGGDPRGDRWNAPHYPHMHVLRDLLTGKWGIPVLGLDSRDTVIALNFNYKVPLDYRKIPAVLEDMEIVAFLSRENHEIITATHTKLKVATGVEEARDNRLDLYLLGDTHDGKLFLCVKDAGAQQFPAEIYDVRGIKLNTTLPYDHKNGVVHYDITGLLPNQNLYVIKVGEKAGVIAHQF